MKAAGIIAVSLFLGINTLAQKFDVDTIIYNGISDKRINLVILSDGYTSSEISRFIADATSFTTGYFNETPYKNYQKYFNVFIIKVPSNESGASHPGTAADEPVPALPVITVDNYFGSTFDFAGIHRLLVATKSSVISSVLASNFPNYDQALILVNSPEYGGSGGGLAVASTHTSSIQIAIHELGHSFGGLKDEYWAGDNYAAEGINMTQQTNPVLVKWKNWYGTNGIGIYQHGTTGIPALWYRPHQNCEMRYLNRSFCSVCVQGIVEKIHSLIAPVESYIPTNNNITGIIYPLKFELKIVAPEPNTLRRIWMLNGSSFKRNIDSVFINESHLLKGTNTLIATVEDTTQFLRIDNHAAIHISSVSWSIHKTITGIKKITSYSSEIIIDLYPNPASEYINIRLLGAAKGKIRLEISDLRGKRVKVSSLNSNEVNFVDLNDLSQGIYVARIFMDNNLITSRKIIRN